MRISLVALTFEAGVEAYASDTDEKITEERCKEACIVTVLKAAPDSLIG